MLQRFIIELVVKKHQTKVAAQAEGMTSLGHVSYTLANFQCLTVHVFVAEP